jgi:hypothetical protein
VNAAFHLLGAQTRVDRAADVMGRHDTREVTFVIEDDNLR